MLGKLLPGEESAWHERSEEKKMGGEGSGLPEEMIPQGGPRRPSMSTFQIRMEFSHPTRSRLSAYRTVIVTTPRSMRMINTTTMISGKLLVITHPR
jgi:hypothetical protein